MFVHEFGHYWVARRYGVRAEVFSIGFGPELFGWNDRNGTRWKISRRAAGRLREDAGRHRRHQRHAVRRTSAAPNSSGAPSSASRSMPVPPSCWAGRAANLLFAFVLLTAVFFFAGEPYSPADGRGAAGRPGGQRRGLRTGDEIVRLGDKHVDRYEDIQESQFLYWAKPMAVEYRRGNQLLNAEIVPQFCERTDRYNNTLRFGELGMDQLVRPVVGGFTQNSPAEAAGLKVGDLLLEIDGKPVDYFSHIPELIGSRAGQPVTVKYDREGTRDETTVVPGRRQGARLHGQGAHGRPVARPSRRRRRVPQPRPDRCDGRGRARDLGHDDDILHVDGADRDGDAAGRRARRPDPHRQGCGRGVLAGSAGILNLVIVLSVSLGAVQSVPVPMLDGGHLAMYHYEAVRGKPLSLKMQEFGLKVGLAMVISMVLFATFNDIGLLLR